MQQWQQSPAPALAAPASATAASAAAACAASAAATHLCQASLFSVQARRGCSSPVTLKCASGETVVLHFSFRIV